jgi:hypothetical protein
VKIRTLHVCGLDMDCLRLNHGGKMSCFDCHKNWLLRYHKFRQQKNTFKKDNIVTNGPLKCLSGPQIADMLDVLLCFVLVIYKASELHGASLGISIYHKLTASCPACPTDSILPYHEACLHFANHNSQAIFRLTRLRCIHH